MEILTTFNVNNAHCYDPNEEAKLRRVISAVGTEVKSDFSQIKHGGSI